MLIKLSLRTSQRLTLPFLVGGLLGCSSLTDLGNALPFQNYSLTPIQEAPQQTQGATIYLEGQVSDQAPFLGSGAYELQDSTGSVWVRTNQTLPNKGEKLVIKGQVDYQSIPVGSQELGEVYILELEQVRHQQASEPQPAQSAQPAIKPIQDLLLDHKQHQK